MWTQITLALTPLSPRCHCHIQMQMGHLMKNTWGVSCYSLHCLRWQCVRWTAPGVTAADAFIRKHLNDAAATNNLHNCSHCLNHSDHQQASLDISLSGFHQPMIVIVMTSWWILPHWPGSVALSPSRLTQHHLLHLWLGTFDLVTL